MDVISDVFKVYSRKAGFSVFITSQYYFEGGREAVVIRGNCSHVLALENVVQPSYRITSNPDINKMFKEATKYAYRKPHGYVLVNLNSGVSDKFRVCTNLFRENPDIPYPLFFT